MFSSFIAILFLSGIFFENILFAEVFFAKVLLHAVFSVFAIAISTAFLIAIVFSVAAFSSARSLSAEEVAQLRRMIDEWEAGK